MVQIETDSSLDELARDYVLQSVSTRRKPLASSKFRIQQPAKVQNRRRQTVSLSRPSGTTSNGQNDRAVNQRRKMITENQDQAVAGTSSCFNATAKGEEGKSFPGCIIKRRKTVTFGKNSYIDHNDFVIRMDRIHSLANISKGDVPSMPHYRNIGRSSSTGNAYELMSSDPTEPEKSNVATSEQIILSPTTTESAVSQEKSADTDPDDENPDELSFLFSTEQIDDDAPKSLTVQTNGQSAECSNQERITRSPSPLINFSNDEVSLNVHPTQGTVMEPQLSEVDILMGLNEEGPMELQPCLPPHKITKKPVPDLLPIEVMQTSKITRRRQSLTARYLIAVIDEIDSMGIEPNQNKASEVTAIDKEASTISMDFDDEDFGKLHYSDSE